MCAEKLIIWFVWFHCSDVIRIHFLFLTKIRPMDAIKLSFTLNTTYTQPVISQCSNKQLIRNEKRESELTTSFLHSSLLLLVFCQLYNELFSRMSVRLTATNKGEQTDGKSPLVMKELNLFGRAFQGTPERG